VKQYLNLALINVRALVPKGVGGRSGLMGEQSIFDVRENKVRKKRASTKLFLIPSTYWSFEPDIHKQMRSGYNSRAREVRIQSTKQNPNNTSNPRSQLAAAISQRLGKPGQGFRVETQAK